MEFATVAAMRKIEELENQKGTSYLQMMLDAGKSATTIIAANYEVKDKQVVVLCGNGNNGGDGFVVAQGLLDRGAKVTVLLCCGQPKTLESKTVFEQMDAGVCIVDDFAQCSVGCCDFIIDAVFGIGFHGSIPQELEDVFSACYASTAVKIALDIPSGVEGDNGRFVECFHADLTIAIAALKPAHLVSWRETTCGKVLVANTSLTNTALESKLLLKALTAEICTLPKRLPWSHKGDNGSLAVICGSAQYTGAAVFTCASALRSGCGYVYLLSTKKVCKQVSSHFPEVICVTLQENGSGGIDRSNISTILAQLQKSDAAVVGCGMGNTHDTACIVQALLNKSQVPLVLDADALNVLAGKLSLLEKANCPVAITPHPGEFSRLAKMHIYMACGDYTLAAARLSAQSKAVVLLKGAVTAIMRGEKQPIFSFGGNDALARGGSGDLLSGIIGALAAQGLGLDLAVPTGAWLHGRCAELAVAQGSKRSVLPSDLVAYLSQALSELEQLK